MKVDTQLVGAAGEHLVLSRLLSRGMLAAQAPRGVRKADILVNHLDGKAPCLIQVKAKHEEITDKDLFYCFVDLSEEHPVVYVVPAEVVATVVRESHSVWLQTPGKNGQQHSDSEMRQIKLNPGQSLHSAPDGWMEQYLEAWSLLE